MTVNTNRLTQTRGRRRGAAFLAAASILIVAGCGSSDDGDTTADGDAPEASPSATASPTDAPSAEPTTVPGAGVTGVTENARLLPQESVFSVLSPWNTLATGRGIHPRSEGLLEQAKIKVGVDLNGNPAREVVDEGAYINTRAWTGPVVADGDPTIVRCRQVQCGDGTEDITLTIPDDVDPDPRYDGWYTVFDTDDQKAYDLWRARREDDGSISYQFMRQWDLNGPGFQKPYVVSARGSGLPLFGGLIRSGELERGEVNHALAISVPGAAAGSFIQPASSTDGNGPVNSLPEGARIFLKSDFQLQRPVDQDTGRPYKWTARQQKYARYLIETLKTYGAIVVDRAAVPTFYFERIEDNERTPLLRGYELNSIGLEDFNVVAFDGDDRIQYPPADETVDSTDLEGQAPVLTQGVSN
ncbi:hypothetical protein [Nocardioides sp.]|jgi:hypothetical protein|uniref:hypothetical protein n=1 Tax=Nocardioides sp. TaxID=35761 RepID=UPI001D4DCC65|nr:hypothetical protein [Nocardioides sp.]MBU1803116.1 hypothetical protein [Actinomycetota bacterium]